MSLSKSFSHVATHGLLGEVLGHPSCRVWLDLNRVRMLVWLTGSPSEHTGHCCKHTDYDVPVIAMDIGFICLCEMSGLWDLSIIQRRKSNTPSLFPPRHFSLNIDPLSPGKTWSDFKNKPLFFLFFWQVMESVIYLQAFKCLALFGCQLIWEYNQSGALCPCFRVWLAVFFFGFFFRLYFTVSLQLPLFKNRISRESKHCHLLSRLCCVVEVCVQSCQQSLLMLCCQAPVSEQHHRSTHFP